MSDHVNNEFKGLKEKLTGFRVDPPREIWGNIASAMDGKGRRRNMIILLSAAASIALAVTLGISFLDFNRPEANTIASDSRELGDQPLQQSTVVSPEPAGKTGQIAEQDPGAGVEDPGQQATREDMTKQGKLERKVTEALSQMQDKSLIVAEAASEREVVPGDDRELGYEHDGYDGKTIPEYTQEITETLEQGLAVIDSGGADEGLKERAEEDEEVVIDEDLPLQEEFFDEEVADPRDIRWIIGGVISPLYSFRDASGTVASNNSVNNIESAMIAYAGGINVGFQPGSRFTIESGILYNKMGINIGEVTGASGQGRLFDLTPVSNETMNANVIPVSNSIGNIVSNSGDIFINSYKQSGIYELDIIDGVDSYDQIVTMDEVKQNLEYLEIPLNLRYSVIDRSVELQLIGGISTNFLVNNTVTAQTADGTEEIGYASNLNSVNYSGNAGIGMIFHFHSNFSIGIEPRFRYYLNSINDQSLPATRPYTIGFYTGINYRF